MSSEVGLELAVSKIPDLDDFVPASRNNDGVGLVGRESDAADPFTVRGVVIDGVFALSQSVPELDGLVSRSRDDLSVVCREGNTQNVLGVSNESSGGGSKVQIPQSKGRVPRSRESELSVRGDDDILNKVGVTGEGSSRNSILFRFSGNLPDHESLISRSREEHIGIFSRSRDTGDPAIVSFKDSSKIHYVLGRHA